MRSASKRWQIGLASMVSPVQSTLISRGEEEEHQLRYPDYVHGSDGGFAMCCIPRHST